MKSLLSIAVFAMLAMLMAACVVPAPTSEQLEAYATYAELRATEAAASQIVAASKATEAAAAQQIAQLTAEAASAGGAMTVTATLTPTQIVTLTAPLTGTVVAAVEATTATLTPAAVISATPAVTVTSSVAITVTAPPVTTPQPTATAVVTATIVATTTPSAQSTITWQEAWPWVEALAPGDSAGQEIIAALATPTPTPTPAGNATVTSQQANMRSGPGLVFDVVAIARAGDVFDVYGRDATQNWWQVCCKDSKSGWISNTVARFQGDAQAVPVVGPLMPDDLEASWAMRWECHGRGCNREVCTGQSSAAALRVLDARWLEVKRQAIWDDACGEPEDWLSQVDRYTGRERQSTANAALFIIWEGANPGPANRSVLLAGAQLALWCTDTRTQEQAQPDGWTVVFEGQACYDTKAGVLALMQYVKRWLFTGTVDGQTFDRQYFGDYEVIQQVLVDTNVPLSGR